MGQDFETYKVEELSEDFRQEKVDVKNIKQDIKSITTTIISTIISKGVDNKNEIDNQTEFNT